MVQPYLLVPAQGSDQADEWHRLGLEAQLAGQLPLAQQRYQQALRLDPRHALATLNLSIVFAQSNLINEALLTVDRAAMFDGVHAIVKMNHALMALEAERIDEALEQAHKAVDMSKPGPEANPARMVLAMVVTTAGMPNEAIPLYNEILDTEPTHPVAGMNACFVQTLTNATPAELLKQRQRWYQAWRFDGKQQPHNNDRTWVASSKNVGLPPPIGDGYSGENPDATRQLNRPLRVGYVGGDFKAHSAAFIFSRVLFHHSPAVEMYLYATLAVDATNDAKTKRFTELAGDRWRDISAMTDEDADRMIRKDKIDILVDLAAHTNGGRLTLFTRKPAPVQVTAWGFAHGSGLPEIDYFFADPIAVPESERQHYAEKVVDLPCIVTMEPPTEYNLKGTSSLPYKRNGYITFGSYARYEKMSDECLRTFAEILKRIPDAKMQFKDNAYRRPYAIRRIMGLMPDIEPERLLFSIATTHPDHMLAYQQCDIACDPWPHGGGVVALEQLYMGVPVLTKYGTQPSGRSAASVLTAMGRVGWIAKTPEEYIDRAVSMADDPKMLAAARQTLQKELLDSPVTKGYVEAVEAKYREIWEAWCKA